MSLSGSYDGLLSITEDHKITLKNKYEYLFESVAVKDNQTLLSSISTELYITEGEGQGVNEKYEVMQMEIAPSTQISQDKLINCNDIFKLLPTNGPEEDDHPTSKDIKRKEEKGIKTVLTKGIAGIGKTVSVQKFILDWAEGRANQDINFMFILPFRELNLIKDDQFSLHGLLQEFHPNLKKMHSKKYDDCKILFIFDGLDESRLHLDFSEVLFNVTKTSSVNILISNLIKGNLLPSARIWITSRPAATSQIPSQFISRMTEIQGFSDPQKDEYFRKKIRDESQANRIISHIKTSVSLHIMCRIPVFCRISATVLQEMLRQDNGNKIPKTLTEMYTHFLLIQTKRNKLKYKEMVETHSKNLLELNKDVFLKLAKLAFNQLLRGNVIFYDEDLRECGIDVSEATVYSGICTEIFKEEAVLHQKKVYCFVHLSLQEFFAALYVFCCYANKNMEVLENFLQRKTRAFSKKIMEKLVRETRMKPENVPLDELLEGAVDKSLESKNGHLDLFVRFLHGISLESNQKLLQGLLKHTQSTQESINKISCYIKKLNKDDVPPERWINLLHCLTEMNECSLHEEIKAFVETHNYSTKLSLAHCTALAYFFLMSEEVLDELDLKKYNTIDEGRRRLLPAVRCCRRALLTTCKLSEKYCETLVSALQSATCPLIELDLSDNDLQDSGVKLLCAGLESPHCKLEILRLVLCNFTEKSCSSIASVLQSANCLLRELDLSNNDLQDSGVTLLCEGLGDPQCKLQILRLSGCLVTEESCFLLASALCSNPSHLRELDLSYNHPGNLGVGLLSARLEDPHCQLNTLNVDNGGQSRIKPGLRKYACELTLDPNTAHKHLSLSDGHRTVTRGDIQSYLDHPERFEKEPQVVCRESLTGRCYWEVSLYQAEVVNIAVTYKGIGRKGESDNCRLGYNEKSWSLICSRSSFSACHNKQSNSIPVTPGCKIGVYLDWLSGTVSFYRISSKKRPEHLHTFYCTFTEPLYAGFRLYSLQSSVSLCQ
ncbi:NACHT, LRR and PYD domains-containing protein 3-like, partial [Chanos chanos]|uniref:NACHT, LRR and PYD domains-containing protein 3-like n=1 Tax=Chanos chanos TaxID=29144 RepID=A0A6J2VPQ0_CHACN